MIDVDVNEYLKVLTDYISTKIVNTHFELVISILFASPKGSSCFKLSTISLLICVKEIFASI